MHNFELYIRDDGSFGYRVFQDGAIRVDQYYAPGLSGLVQMTADQATAYAEADVALRDAPQPEPEAEPTGASPSPPHEEAS